MTDEPIVYLDSTNFIYALEGVSDVSRSAQKLFALLRDRPGLGPTSELTLAEVLAPSRQGRARPAPLKRQYLNLIVHSGMIALHPVSRGILLETARLRATRATAGMKLPDAIYLATAIGAGCLFFASDDKKIRLPREMKRVTCDDTSISAFVRAVA